MHANYASAPNSMMNQMIPMDENMGSFPLLNVEAKIRVPDKLIGRLIGKHGNCLKKIIEETQSHISISDAHNQQEIQQFQTPELLDRIITIRGPSFHTVMTAEKNVQQKLRQFHNQDMNSAVGGGTGQPQHQQQYCQTPTSVLLNTMDNIGPYISPGGVVTPHNAYHPHQTAAYNAQCIPMGVSPQSFYIQNPTVLSTGHHFTGHNIPMHSILIKSRVYVPNQIVGILIGTKGQTIKSVIAESGAIISIEGDRDHQSSRKEEKKENCGGGGQQEKQQQPAEPAELDGHAGGEGEEVVATTGKEAESVEEVAASKSPPLEEAVAENSGGSVVDTPEIRDNSSSPQQQQQELVPIEQQLSSADNATNGTKNGTTKTAAARPKSSINNNNINHAGSSERSVFIQGYDFQVAKAQLWVFQKIAEHQNKHIEEVVLPCEAIVPSKVIGRIIGKGGHNVKQLQQRSGATIKVPDDINASDKNCVMEAAVRVMGTFYAVQTVQHHFGTLITEAEWRESREYDERRSRFSGGCREGSR